MIRDEKEEQVESGWLDRVINSVHSEVSHWPETRLTGGSAAERNASHSATGVDRQGMRAMSMAGSGRRSFTR
jgi:hypothetical protein